MLFTKCERKVNELNKQKKCESVSYLSLKHRKNDSKRVETKCDGFCFHPPLTSKTDVRLPLRFDAY